MSDFFDSLMTGLNEAVAIERGELKGRKTVYEIQPIKKYSSRTSPHICGARDHTTRYCLL